MHFKLINKIVLQDIFVLETPGGGGWGCPKNQDKSSKQDNRAIDESRDESRGKIAKVEVRGSVAQYVKNQESA